MSREDIQEPMFDEAVTEERRPPQLFAVDRPSGAPAAWAMTDLIFQLLIVFVLGVSATPLLETPVQADASWLEGPATPLYGKQINFRVLQVATAETERFRLIVDSNPRVLEPWEGRAEGRDQLVAEVLRWEPRLQQLADENSDYFIRRTFIGPREAAYETMLRTFSLLQDASGFVWLAGMYDPAASAETVSPVNELRSSTSGAMDRGGDV